MAATQSGDLEKMKDRASRSGVTHKDEWLKTCWGFRRGGEMESPMTAAEHVEYRSERVPHSSGVAWGAVIGGAFVAAAVYLLLLALGAGFGLSAISPWSNIGAYASTLGTIAIVWLILTEVISSAFGGYMTGRLRTKWATVHTDEVYFRDTANGFLAWAVALVISVTFLASAAATMVGGATVVAATNSNAYYVDTLFRSDTGSLASVSPATQSEAETIFANAVAKDQIPAADRNYLARLISAKTGISQADAEKRISDTFTDARQAADTERKATARLLLWSFLALLMGAFSASYFATIGGRLRDHVKAV